MLWLDIFIIASLAVALFAGIKVGGVGMFVPLAGVAIGVNLAGRFHQAIARGLFSSSSDGARMAAFVLILVLVLFGLVGVIAGRALSFLRLGWLNGLLGSVLGLVIVAGLWEAGLALLLRFYPTARETVQASFMASLVLDRFPFLLALLPEEFGRFRPLFP